MSSGKSRRKAAPERELSLGELEAEVRRSVLATPGLSSKDLSKAVPKAQGEGALRLARELVAKGELFRWAKGKQERFFPSDPIPALDRLAKEALREGALDSAQLKREIERRSRGHAPLLAEWLKGALGRRVLFQHAPQPPSKSKRFGAEPDLGLLLKKPLAELTKCLPGLDALSVPREKVVSFLSVALGTSRESRSAGNGEGSRRLFLDALRRLAAENPKGALLPVRELRTRTALDKQRFDDVALALSKEGLLVLHHHDHAMALSEAERSALVKDDRGVHYVGVALRGPA